MFKRENKVLIKILQRLLLQHKTSTYNSHQSKHQHNKLALDWGSSTTNFGLEIIVFGKVITESWIGPSIKSCDRSKPLERRSIKWPGCVGLWEMQRWAHSVERYWWYRVWEWIRIRRIWIKPKINETINFRSMKASGPVHIGLEVSRISTLELQTFPSTEPWSWCFFSRHFEGLTEYCNALVLSIRWLERFAPLALYFCLQLDHLSILSQLWPLLRCISFPISQSNIAKKQANSKMKKTLDAKALVDYIRFFIRFTLSDQSSIFIQDASTSKNVTWKLYIWATWYSPRSTH